MAADIKVVNMKNKSARYLNHPQNSLVRAKKQKGFGILEILITVFVLAVGLLGIASLQTLGFRSSQSSYMRTIAAYKSYEMIDRMRANPSGISAGSYNAISGIPSASDCTSSSCSTSQMATFDANQWNTELQGLLPSGQGTVTGAGSGTVFQVVIRWDEDRTGATGAGCTDSDTDLQCFTVNVQL